MFTERNLILDSQFQVATTSCTPHPQTQAWLDMHQCYSSEPVWDCLHPDEARCGELVVKHCLDKGGHYGVLESSMIAVNFVGFPHSVMQQLRTHRVGITFNVQSFRYTSQRLLKAVEAFGDGSEDAHSLLEQAVYVRPAGTYWNRQGKSAVYTVEQRQEDLAVALLGLKQYATRFKQGLPEEHCRQSVPFEVRQHFTMGCTLRTALHLLGVRYQADVQPECFTAMAHFFCCLQDWSPEIVRWYAIRHLGKNRLSP